MEAIKTCARDMGLQQSFLKRMRTRNKNRYKINKKTGCWEWLMSVDNDNGYAREGKNEITGSKWAHINSYVKHKGPIPDGYEIDHLCRNTECINPNHLEAVTPKENVRRSRNHEIADKILRKATI